MPRSIARIAPLAWVAAVGCTGTSRPDLGSLLTPMPKIVTASKPATAAPGTPAPSLDLPSTESANLMLTMAQSLDAAGKDAEALMHYEKARVENAKFPDAALQRVAVLYDRLGDQPRALAILRELRERHPADPDLLNDLGYSLYNRGDWAEAEKVLQEAVKKNPKHARAWMNLGMAQAQQGRADEAFASFTRAVSPADAHANIGFICLTRKETDAARRHYRTALELEPQHVLARKMVQKLEATP